jgi:tRNA-uridine 2-sulfurtransferase
MPRAIVLFTGSLDAMLAARALLDQGCEIEALHFRTLWGCGRGEVEKAANSLGIPLITRDVGDDYLDILRRPRFGFGPAKNPCIDCRIHLFRMAAAYLRETKADLIASGEILGQRPIGQRRKDLEVIAYHSGVGERLLRPLSAKLLPETAVERSGLVDRSRLFAFHGSGRRELIELAKQWRFPYLPPPSAGCPAAQKPLAALLRDLLDHHPDACRADFEMLRFGRHYRIDERTKLVLGRQKVENLYLRQLAEKCEAERVIFLEPKTFFGPSAVLRGENPETALPIAAGMLINDSDAQNGSSAEFLVRKGREETVFSGEIAPDLQKLKRIQ